MSDQPDDSGKPQDAAPAPVAAAPALSVVPPPITDDAPERDPAEADLFDPNRNIVYDILYDIGDLEMVARLKWDLFAVEQRLERALAEDADLERFAPELKKELEISLTLFRQDDDVRAYKERFVRSEDRLKLMELIRFLELAIRVRQPLHEAWTKYLEASHRRLLAELATVDTDGLAKRPAQLLGGVRETASRRCVAVIVHTERNARQIYAEIPYRDFTRLIGWYEEKNALLANLVAEARVLYLHTGLAKRSGDVAGQLKWVALAIAAFTLVSASAAIAVFLR